MTVCCANLAPAGGLPGCSPSQSPLLLSSIHPTQHHAARCTRFAAGNPGDMPSLVTDMPSLVTGMPSLVSTPPSLQVAAFPFKRRALQQGCTSAQSCSTPVQPPFRKLCPSTWISIPTQMMRGASTYCLDRTLNCTDAQGLGLCSAQLLTPQVNPGSRYHGGRST